MDALFFLVPLAVLLGGVFAFLFVRAARDGQFEDLDDEARRAIEED